MADQTIVCGETATLLFFHLSGSTMLHRWPDAIYSDPDRINGRREDSHVMPIGSVAVFGIVALFCRVDL